MASESPTSPPRETDAGWSLASLDLSERPVSSPAKSPASRTDASPPTDWLAGLNGKPAAAQPPPPGQPEASKAQAVAPPEPPPPPAKPRKTKLKIDPELDAPAEPEPLLTPEKLKSSLTSAGVHALLLVLLALWVFHAPEIGKTTLNSRMDSYGNLNGIPEGTDLGRIGDLDAPLVPDNFDTEAKLGVPELTRIDIEPVKIATIKGAAKAEKGSSGAGVNLSSLAGGGGGTGEGFGIAKFGNGKENVGGVQVKVGDPQFTLIWDNKGDLDLHVIEPGGDEIFWLDKLTKNGGELDVDNQDGYGPENIFWVTGKGPPGEYKWFVHYYPGFNDFAGPANWKVRIKHNGQVKIYKGKLSHIDARSKVYTLKVGGGDTDPSPGDETPKAAKASPTKKPAR